VLLLGNSNQHLGLWNKKNFCLFGFFASFKNHSYIYLLVYTLFESSPHPPHPPPGPNHNILGRTCFALLFSHFWRENIRDNKKDIVFLLVWDKDSYTERFLALLPCTCVLQLTLVHVYQTSSLLPSPPPIVALASLRLLYLFLYSKHINHIQVLEIKILTLDHI
jgi:hypothetical protein